MSDRLMRAPKSAQEYEDAIRKLVDAAIDVGFRVFAVQSGAEKGKIKVVDE